MTSKLLFDGFYHSKSLPWEDRHAGVRMHGHYIHYRRFYENYDWVGCCRVRPIDFWTQTCELSSDEINLFKRGRSPLDTEANPLWIGGTFEIDGDQLTARMAPDFAGGHVWEAIFRILDDRIVALDGNLAFLFKPEPIN